MKFINYIISYLIVKRKKYILGKKLNVLRKKLELKKILDCTVSGTCNEKNCPFFPIIEKYNKDVKL